MVDNSGWIKLHRVILDNPVVTKDSDHFFVWCYLLLNATHKPHDTMFGKERITLLPGQLVTGRKRIAKNLGVNEYKVMRILKRLENAQQITQQSKPFGTLITILNWQRYQQIAQPDAQQLHTPCTSTAQPVHTIQECKNGENGENVRSSPLKEERSARARENPIDRINRDGYQDPWTGEWMEIPSEEEIRRRMRGGNQ